MKLKSFCFAIQHLTRITVYKGDFDEAAFGRAAMFFPIVGLLLGLLLWLSKILLDQIFPAPLVAAMLVIIIVVVTGGIHLDGFMDSVDGLFSGRPRERKLEIMRDSRVGAFGVLGLVCLLLLKYNVFLTIAVTTVFQSMILAMVLSRWTMVYVIVGFRYARQEGMGKLNKQYTAKKELFWATVSTILIAGLVSGFVGVFLLLIAWGWGYFIGHRVTSELGGLTGDIYGATAETTEIVVYLTAVILFKYCPTIFTLSCIDYLKA